MVYLYKALVLSNDHNIHVKTTDRLTRENDGTAKIILQVPRVNTLTFQNSYYCRSPRTFNGSPSQLRQSNLSISQFKCGLFKYYQKLVEEVYDIDVPLLDDTSQIIQPLAVDGFVFSYLRTIY